MANRVDSFITALSKLKSNLMKAEEEYENDVQDYGLDEEDLEGLSVVDDPFQEEDDEAAKWLKEQEGKEAPKEESEEAKPKEKKVSQSGYSDWKPHGDYSDKHKADMDKLMEEGYSHREAERLVGAHKGPSDFQTALQHPVRPSQPSEKMLGELRELAGPWLENAERHSQINADPEKNPDKFAAGQLRQAHDQHAGDYSKAYHDFLSSDEIKGMKGLDRHKAVREWKKQWHAQNPEHKEKGIELASGAQQQSTEAQQAAKRSLDERIAHISSGGQGGAGMSMQEAAQHVGGTKTDEGYTASTVKDPAASFAQQNPELIRILKQHPKGSDMMDRMNRVNAARASKGVIIRRKGDK